MVPSLGLRDGCKDQGHKYCNLELSPLQDVPDPYYSDDATFDRVLGMIERSTSALFRQLAPALRQGLR